MTKRPDVVTASEWTRALKRQEKHRTRLQRLGLKFARVEAAAARGELSGIETDIVKGLRKLAEDPMMSVQVVRTPPVRLRRAAKKTKR